MNEIALTKKTAHLFDYDVNVNKYLTIAEIQQITNAVVKMETWAGREQNIVMLVMYHATDIEPNKLEEIGADKIVESGLFDAVTHEIINYNKLEEAIKYTESISRNFGLILKNAGPQINEVLEVIGKKYGKAKE